MKSVILNSVVLSIGLFLLLPGTAMACESYNQHNLDEIKEFRGILQNKDADSLDRLFAFEQMACSDRPTVRHFALKEGLNNISDPLVRNEIMLKAMMQKTRIDIELANARTLSAEDKEFIAENGGIFSQQVKFRSASDGCIGLYRKECGNDYSLWIRGDKVELNFRPVSGEFRLSESNELVGTLRAKNEKEYTRIPAVIKLF